MERENRPIEIVISGGPCSGKTTGIERVAKKLRDIGFRVLTVREIATDIILGGVSDINDFEKNDLRTYLEIERHILLRQRSIRKELNNLAKTFASERVVILYDRAEANCSAYLPQGYFEALMQESGLNWHHVRDSYDAVFHLVTAADGAEEFYTIRNNKARRETEFEEARQQDSKTLAAWIGHPHLRVIDNSTDFDEKVERLFEAICRVLAIPAPLETERRFLLARAPNFRQVALRDAQRVRIEQIYLNPTSDGRLLRIRRRSQGDSATCYITEKAPVSVRTRYEIENLISPTEHLIRRGDINPETVPIQKYRYYFVFNNQYFELDRFLEPAWVRGEYILEIELEDENTPVTLPSFLDIDREVTGDPEYTNYEIAKNK